MPFMADQVETVTRVRPAPKDAYGDQLPGAPPLSIDGCLFAPGPSPETAPGQGSNEVDIDGTVYIPPDALPVGEQVLPTDELTIRGDLYQVVNQPQLWPGWGIVVAVRRSTG